MSDSDLWKNWRRISANNDASELETLWGLHHDELVRAAQDWLDRMCVRSNAADGIAVQTAFEIFCCGESSKSGESLRGADELWRIIATLVVQQQRLSSAIVPKPEPVAESETLAESQSPNDASTSIPPDFAQKMTLRLRGLLNLLADVDLEMAVLAKLSGATDNEVALAMEYTRRTIQRMLKLIRSIWLEELNTSD